MDYAQNNYMPNNNMMGGMPNNMMNNMDMNMNMNNMQYNMNGMNNCNPGNFNPQMNNGMMNNNNMMNPGMMNPGMMNPGMMNPGMMNPGMMNPGMMNQAMINNGMMNMMANVAALGQMQNMMLNQLKNLQMQQQQQQQQQLNLTQTIPNNQTNNTNMSVNNYQNTNPGNGMISLMFARTNPDQNINFQITIVCSPNDTIGHVIDKYLTKSMEKKNDVIFLFNATQLEKIPNRTVNSLGLIHQSKIMVVNKRNAVAGF